MRSDRRLLAVLLAWSSSAMSRQRCLVCVVLALLGVVVPAGDDAGAAASAPNCRTEPNLRGVSVFVGNVLEGVALELVVDDVVIDRAAALGAGVETVLFAPAEDAAAHRFVVTIDEGPTIECGSAAVAAFPRTTVSCTIDRVVDGAPHVVHDSPYAGMVLTRDGSVLAAREITNGFVDLSARPSTRYRYAVRFVGPGSVVDVPCGAVTTPSRTVAQRLATTRYFESITLAPSVYVRQRPTCAGCDEPFRVYSATWPSEDVTLPGGPSSVVCAPSDLGCGYRYDPAFEEQGTVPVGHPGLFAPRELSRRLVEAIDAGADVDFTTDGFGLISGWRIDGFGGEIPCTEFDTRPPEQHDDTCSIGHLTLLVRDATNLSALLDSRDAPGSARGILRLYHAYFGRTPDLAGARYWVDLAAQGLDPAGIAENFTSSEESRLRWGAESTEAFIERLYTNVLQRPPDPEGAAYWAGLLDAGLARGRVIWWFAESNEFRRQHSYSPAYVSDHREELIDR